MKNLFKKQFGKFVQNPSLFRKVMAKHILVCFYAPQCRNGFGTVTVVSMSALPGRAQSLV